MYLLGIDIGSTTIKAVIFRYNGNLVSMGRRETKLFVNNEEYFWKPEDIWQAVCESIKEAIANIEKPEQIKAVAVSGFGQDAVPLDKQGKCLYPFISWHDKKTGEQMNELLTKIGDREIYNISGAKPWHIHTIYRIMWLKKHEPSIYKKVFKWLPITDYINYKLCGSILTDFSEASTTSLLDQSDLNWSKTCLLYTSRCV